MWPIFSYGKNKNSKTLIFFFFFDFIYCVPIKKLLSKHLPRCYFYIPPEQNKYDYMSINITKLVA